MVFYDGLPLLIDVGRGTYTRKTFSDKRYTIWYNRSDYHNLPSVNGHSQSPGSRYRASDISYDARKNRSTLAMDISKAYPDNAGIESWHRTLRLDRGRRVTVTDEYQLSVGKGLTQHLMTVYPATLVSPGKIRIPFENEDGEELPFLVSYDPEKMDVMIEKIDLTEPEDQGVEQKWGDRIYRINLEHNPDQSGDIGFEISRE